jgi:hypothetical protein
MRFSIGRSPESRSTFDASAAVYLDCGTTVGMAHVCSAVTTHRAYALFSPALGRSLYLSKTTSPCSIV